MHDSAQSRNRREEIGELIAPHLPSIRRYLFVLHRGNYHEAEDSLQEGLLRAYLNFNSFHGPDGFKTWLFTVCRNAALDAMRRTRRRRESVENHDFLTIAASPYSGPEEVLERDEKRRAVIDALMALPERLRIPLLLKELEGMQVSQVASILELPEGTVKSRLSAGRKGLARQFNRLYGREVEGGKHE